MIPSSRRARGLAFALTVAAAAPAAALDHRATPLEGPAPFRPEHPRGSGLVAYTTAGRAYFDVGAADGLAPGAQVTGRRDGDTARCAVDLVAEHAASCPNAGFRPGERVTFHPGTLPPQPKVLPAVFSEEDLGHRLALVQAAAPPPQVEYKGAAPGAAPTTEMRVRRARWLFADASWAQWSATGGSGIGVGALEVGIHGAPLGAGVTLDLAARGERWTPKANPRFRPNDQTRFYLWQAEVTAPVSRFTLSAGRVLPYGIPGATVFDGASAAVQVGSAQVGLFGGLVPQPDTLSPTSTRATGGGFWNYAHVFPGGAGLRQDGRIALVRSPELGDRVEGSLGAAAWWKAATLSGEAQLGAGGKPKVQSVLDAARVDVTVNAAPGLTLGAGARHSGLAYPDAAASLEPALFPGRSDAGDGWVSWDVWFLRVGARAGTSRDLDSKMDRSWFGPELGVPRLFGRWGGLAGGYLEERGWLPGRSAWLQATLRPSARYSLAVRGTWTYASNALVDANEVGVATSASAELGGGFGLRASLLARTSIGTGEGEAGSTPAGVTGVVGVYASY